MKGVHQPCLKHPAVLNQPVPPSMTAKCLSGSISSSLIVCSVFAYGQTGSGKTYTMRGEQGNPGILPQAATDIFEGVGERVALNLKMSVLELYQDNLVDLLVEPGAGCKLNIRQDEKARPSPAHTAYSAHMPTQCLPLGKSIACSTREEHLTTDVEC